MANPETQATRYFTIGAHADNHIVLTGKYIEPFHARIALKNGEFYLEDLSEHFGVTINGDKMLEPTKLEENSYVKVSTHTIRWQEEVDDILNPKENEFQDFFIEDFVKTTGRLNRKTYRFIFILLLVAPVFIFIGIPSLLVLIWPRFDENAVPELWQWNPIIWTVAIGFLVYVLIAQSVKRLRDTETPTWQWLIPGWNIYLALFK